MGRSIRDAVDVQDEPQHAWLAAAVGFAVLADVLIVLVHVVRAHVRQPVAAVAEHARLLGVSGVRIKQRRHIHRRGR